MRGQAELIATLGEARGWKLAGVRAGLASVIPALWLSGQYSLRSALTFTPSIALLVAALTLVERWQVRLRPRPSAARLTWTLLACAALGALCATIQAAFLQRVLSTGDPIRSYEALVRLLGRAKLIWLSLFQLAAYAPWCLAVAQLHHGDVQPRRPLAKLACGLLIVSSGLFSLLGLHSHGPGLLQLFLLGVAVFAGLTVYSGLVLLGGELIDRALHPAPE